MSISNKGKPEWFKIRPPTGMEHKRISSIIRRHNLHTVCEESHCPNIPECWATHGTATFMILGDICTRGCKFCNVKTGNPMKFIDQDESHKLAKAISEIDLDYVTLTSVDRDDLPDGGAEHFARCIAEVRRQNSSIIIETLIPDFRGNLNSLKKIVDAKPEVISHNIETVERLQKKVRDPRAGYKQSLALLGSVKKMNINIFTKSSIMLGLGEKNQEVIQTMRDLRDRRVDILAIGQYLRPSSKHIEVEKYVHPNEFKFFELEGKEMGFVYVASGPFVRTSYRAGELFIKSVLNGWRIFS